MLHHPTPSHLHRAARGMVQTHGAKPTATNTWRDTPVYTGAELRPYTGRPGAMDAFGKPSRVGHRLHYRDGTVVEGERA